MRSTADTHRFNRQSINRPVVEERVSSSSMSIYQSLTDVLSFPGILIKKKHTGKVCL